MANLYTTIPGLQPSQQEILEAELLAQQILQAQFPDLELRLGTALRDLVIRPAAFLLALTKKGLDYYFTQNTINGVTDATPESVVDDILSNWFLPRNLGTFSVISARLYFARKKNVAVSTSTFFSPDNALLFYPQQAVSLSQDAMLYDSYSNEWYVDVNLQAAQQGVQYNISSGSLLYFSNFDPYFLRAEINYLVSSSVAGETNTQFITRAKTAISTRNLINVPSIAANLQSYFNYISQIVSIGMGDAEMIRDQIKAIFDPETPRLVTALSSTSTTATATLVNHGWDTGQFVVITGATPAAYNGTYQITVVDASTFTYTLLTTAGPVTVLPTIQSQTSPVLVHNGGMIDVYCDSSRANSVVQLTADMNGNITLGGPIYSFSRSSITGGSAEDTIPVTQTVTYSSDTVDQVNGVIHVSSTAHGLANGTSIVVTGLTQSQPIVSISCSGITVTMTCTAHGLTTGVSANIMGVTPSQYDGTYVLTVVDANTLQYTVPANISTAGSGTSMTINNVDIPGITELITVIGPNAFDIPFTKVWTIGAVAGTLVVTYNTPYTVSLPNQRQQTIQSISCVGTVVTATLALHGQVANRYVTISGATPTTYNGQWLISSIVNENQFTYNVPANIATAGTGTIICTSVTPWLDTGFSNRQAYTLSFGASNAYKTASFETNYFQNIASIQTYLSSDTARILSCDPLARGFNFYVLDITVSGLVMIPSSGTVQSVSQSYLSGLVPGQVFTMSDLISALETAGITGIQTPPLVQYTKYTRDLITPVTGTITDHLDPNDKTNVFLLGNVTTNLFA